MAEPIEHYDAAERIGRVAGSSDAEVSAAGVMRALVCTRCSRRRRVGTVAEAHAGPARHTR